MKEKKKEKLGEILRERRRIKRLTLAQLAEISKVSASLLCRFESGTRFPSAKILRRLAEPLDFDVQELFIIAGFLDEPAANDFGHLEPDVAKALSQEPPEIQRMALRILSMMKEMSRK